MKPFDQGQRVSWQGRRASVGYARMNGATVVAYSIVLDDQTHRPTYTGTIVAPADVTELHKCCSRHCPGFAFKASETAHPSDVCHG
jgi:hypothetical protein